MRSITESSGQWQSSQLFLDDRPGLTIQQMCAAARRMKQQHDIQWVACDFFQNIKCPNGKGSRDPVEELSDVSQLWMNMLLELNIGGIMLAQLNRDAKGKPSMHHIKGSGKLLEDATKMILMSRDDRPLEQLLKDEEDHIDAYDAKQCPPLEPEERLILAEIVKNKDGPTGPVWLRLKAPETRFRCLVPDKKLYDASHNRQARNADGRL
jgi:replicative DNA helicase